jgi:Transposase DDE domain group 1
MRVVDVRIPYLGGITLKVNRRGRLETVEVTADGEGFCSQAGALLLVNLADRLGLTEGLSKALAGTRERRSAHDDGEILRDLIVTLVQGGEHLSDLAALSRSARPVRHDGLGLDRLSAAGAGRAV